MRSGAWDIAEGGRARRRIVGAVALSVVGHLALGWWGGAQTRPERAPVPETLTEFELMAMPETPAASLTVEVAQPLEAVGAEPARRRLVASVAALTLPSSDMVSDLTVETAAEPRDDTPPAREGVAPSDVPVLDARTAARTVVGFPTEQGRIAQDNANLTAHLAAAASARPYLSRREPPKLRRTDGGGYVHEAAGYRAYIRRDGSVAFQDRIAHPDGSLDWGSGDADAAGFHFTPFRFDVTDMMLKAMGEELYAPEKRWFLQQTQELREALEAEDRLHLFARAREDLRHALRVLLDDQRLTLSEKRQAVFDLWADCSEDEVGWRGRHVIEDFVRENFPADTPRAFTSDELRGLNQRNASSPRFDPYPAKPPLP